MKQKTKQLIMTLVALLALTTHAWADEPKVYDSGEVELFSLQEGDILMPGVTLTNKGNKEIEAYFSSYRFSRDGVTQSIGSSITTIPFSIGVNGLINTKLSGNNGPYDCMPITEDDKTGNAWVVTYISTASYRPNYKGINLGGIKVTPPGTPFAITWSAATPNTASIDKMPAGNVTVSVEYFPQAELAESGAPAAIADVPANTDEPIVTPGTVANIGTSEVKQGTLKYFVKQATGNTAPTAPDYDTDGWSEDVPTANGLAQGNAYVWYYIKGAEPANIADRTDDNTRSDSDIMPLGTTGFVTLDAEPTYDVSLNKTDLAEGEPAKWSAKSTNVAEVNLGTNDLKGVKKSETVTVTYSGTKKIIGVKAAKKAEAKPLANAATEDLGKVVGADGNIYANKAAAEAVATGNAVAMICYVNEGHGLALALSDISSHYHSWDNSGTYNEGKTAAELCSAWNTSKAVTGATWKLASLSEMSLMINAAGNYAALRDGFSAVGGTNMIDEYYWLSDESSADYAKNINFSYFLTSQEFKYDNEKVRACLAF